MQHGAGQLAGAYLASSWVGCSCSGSTSTVCLSWSSTSLTWPPSPPAAALLAGQLSNLAARKRLLALARLIGY